MRRYRPSGAGVLIGIGCRVPPPLGEQIRRETRSIEPATTYHRFDSDLRLSNLRLIAGNLMSEYVW